jgi:PTH1 family peptidyl-tRNA hydrolase
MKIIVGLGNPGRKYENNRHNVGFQFVDYLSYELGVKSYKDVPPNPYHLTPNLILFKPQTFMNLSGLAVRKLIADYRLPITDLTVVHDDLDIPLGKFHIDFACGPKLHNGIESIEKELKNKNFWRVRIGVDNRQLTGAVDGETYVLQNFRPEEKTIINSLFPRIFIILNTNFLNFLS